MNSKHRLLTTSGWTATAARFVFGALLFCFAAHRVDAQWWWPRRRAARKPTECASERKMYWALGALLEKKGQIQLSVEHYQAALTHGRRFSPEFGRFLENRIADLSRPQ